MTPEAPARPLHRRGGPVALVALGGAVGTTLRAAVAALAAPGGAWPWHTVVVNVLGAFALGMLLEHLARTGPDDGRLRHVRLLVGTGVLGGFTTYSTLALDTVLLAGGGPGAATLYAGGTLVLGALAAAGGMAVGARLRRPAGARRAGTHAHPSGRIP